ncbi:hypothetical protein [Aquimarina sp. I32.4]|uniref:hypothetical protein n=1 Tax=Aquimarina sp. I32.4 TaxID=2053903 RepID=UPI000CDE7EBF|nr:hypothetical protein [Aquimarina sp. I32.4]
MSNKKEQLQQLKRHASRLKKVEKKEPLSQKEWSDLFINTTKAGAAKVTNEVKKDISLFAKKQKASVYQPRNTKKVPKWVYMLIESGKSEEEVFSYVLKRVQRSPNRYSLELLQEIVNDTSRKGNSPEFVKKMIPQELVNSFIKLTNPKK